MSDQPDPLRSPSLEAARINAIKHLRTEVTRLTEALEAVVDAASYQDAVAFAAAALAGEPTDG